MMAATREGTINEAAVRVNQRRVRVFLHLERALKPRVAPAVALRHVVSARDELQALLDELERLIPEDLEEVSER